MSIATKPPTLTFWNHLIEDAVREPDRALSNLKVTSAHHLLSVALLALVLSASAPGTAGAQSGLVAAYGFNENGGGIALDASGNGNTGVLTGPTWTTAGKFGSALSFDGAREA